MAQTPEAALSDEELLRALFDVMSELRQVHSEFKELRADINQTAAEVAALEERIQAFGIAPAAGLAHNEQKK